MGMRYLVVWTGRYRMMRKKTDEEGEGTVGYK